MGCAGCTKIGSKIWSHGSVGRTCWPDQPTPRWLRSVPRMWLGWNALNPAKELVQGAMAQLVEHIVHIDGVVGSSPTGTTTWPVNSVVYRFFFGFLRFGKNLTIQKYRLFPLHHDQKIGNEKPYNRKKSAHTQKNVWTNPPWTDNKKMGLVFATQKFANPSWLYNHCRDYNIIQRLLQKGFEFGIMEKNLPTGSVFKNAILFSLP